MYSGLLCIYFSENYSLEVSASFSADGSVLSLNCTLSHGDNLLPEQELVWTEGGLEILSRENGDMTVHQSNTSTLLTIYNVSPGLHYGAYGCRCHNRYSYTTNMLRKLIDKRSYVQYCSSTSTTVAAPEEGQSMKPFDNSSLVIRLFKCLKYLNTSYAWYFVKP